MKHKPQISRNVLQFERTRVARSVTWALASLVAVSHGAQAQSTPPAATETTPLPTVQVTGKREGNAQALPAPYAGGQVANGGRLGILGNRDVIDTPFNITSYTSELIENQQAKTLADVVANDSSVRMDVRGQGTAVGGGDNFMIRGFPLGNRDVSFNGLYGVLPYATIPVQTVERVEILKGPNALLNGMAPSGGVGGSINIVPKRASDVPLSRLTATYSSDSQLGGQIDIGRRFGQDHEWGVRVNGIYTNGDGAVDGQENILGVATVGVDYRGQRVRLSADIGYQDDTTNAPSPFYALDSGVTVIPRAPDASSRKAQPWEKRAFKDTYMLFSGEVDLTSNFTAYAAAGQRDHKHQLLRGENELLGNAGVFDSYPSTYPEFSDTESYQAGVRGTFKTGSVGHSVNVGWSSLNVEAGFGIAYASPTTSSLYQLAPVNAPTFTPPIVAKKSSDTTLESFALADTLSFAQDTVLLTLGLRQQKVTIDRFNQTTGQVSSTYNTSATTPAVGLVYKPIANLSLYGNYIEGLSEGQVVQGVLFEPKKTEQKEIGVKRDFGAVTATVSLFEITQPGQIVAQGTGPSRTFTRDGEQRNTGLEFNSFGQLSSQVRLLGGITYIKPEQIKTAAASPANGRDAIGVPRTLANLGVEWDTPFAPGLSLSGRVIGTSHQYANATSTVRLGGWGRLDAGANYKTSAAGHPLVLRAFVINLADRDYWEGVNGSTGVRLAAPRTLNLSASVDF